MLPREWITWEEQCYCMPCFQNMHEKQTYEKFINLKFKNNYSDERFFFPEKSLLYQHSEQSIKI